MDPELESRFDNLAGLIARSFESMGKRFDERFTAIDGRLDRLERRVEVMDARFTEGFISVDARSGTLELRFEQFEGRMTETVTRLHEEVSVLSRRMDTMNGRVERVEDGLLQLKHRFDGFSDDIRQRFRVVNERLP